MKNQHELFVVEDCEDGEWISSLDGADYSVYHTFAEAEYALAAEADSREPSSHFEIVRFARVAAPPSLPVQDDGWVRVEDRLPGLVNVWPDGPHCCRESELVLVRYMEYGRVVCHRVASIGDYDGGEKSWSEVGGDIIKGVTHWRPLPAPPGTSPAPAVQDERAEFEAWCRDVMLCDPENLERLTAGRGSYRFHNVQCWFMGWQARASRSASADGKEK